MSLFLGLIAGCHVPDPGGSPTVAAVCADPAAREERGWDVVEIPGDPADEDRFWGGGIVAGDFDGDGDLDLLAPGPEHTRLLRNDGGTWVDDPTAVPDADYSRAAGGAAADFDADGDLDVVVTRWGLGDLLLVNDGGRFTVSPALPELPGHDQSAAWADANGDGVLDLVISGHGVAKPGEHVSVEGPGDPTRLWVGDGDGGFVDRTDLFPPAVRDAYTYVAGWSDLDGDLHPDLVLANDYPVVVPSLSATNRAGGFLLDPGLGLTLKRAGMGLAIGDIDGDAVDDFLMPVWDEVLTLTSVGGVWVNAGEALGIGMPPRDEAWIGWGAEWADLDNDGDLDGIVAFGHLDAVGEYTPSGGTTVNAAEQRFAVYLQDDGRFTEQAEALGLDDLGVWRGFVVADLNGDGWPDLAKRNLEGPIVLQLSRCGDAGWLKVVPEPMDRAIGAVVTVTAGDRSWVRTVHAGGTSLNSGGPPELLFGLGEAEGADVDVRWPDGEHTVVEGVEGRTVVTVR